MSGADVSVVIPSRDGARYLAEGLDSILGGTVQPREVIVVDDGSEDRTVAVAESFGEPVTCVSQGPLGLAAACNRGVSGSSGRFLAFLDHDDLWTPEKLELQLESLAEYPEIDAVFGHVVEFASPEVADEIRGDVVIHEEPTRTRLRGTMLARRELFERIGLFDESIRVGDFVDWQARAEDAGVRFVVRDEVVLRRRLHQTNMGRIGPDPSLEYVKVVREVLRRRREASR